MNPILTKHAQYRAAQANIKEDQINIVLQFGSFKNKAHALFCFLAKRNLPEQLLHDDYFAKLAGTMLVMDPIGQVITTVYKNKKAIKKIKHKR